MKTIGEKIKELRLEKGISQTDLSEKLSLSNQAVSKWENNFSQPDINLLPEIASIFGVNIDDLFEYSNEKQYEKIDNSIETGRLMTNDEFNKSEEFLLYEIRKNSQNYRANYTLASLYLSHGSNLHRKAVEFAKKSLSLKPNSKSDINIINNGSNGAMYDWDTKNHHELIDYYIRTLKSHPENSRLYFYLLDNLIEDGRFNDAEKYLKESFKYNPDKLNEYYELFIIENKKGFDSVRENYLQLADKYNDWRILFAVANSFSQNEHYVEAIKLWERAFHAQEKPRYTDYHEAIALCYIRLGDKKNAIKAYKSEIKLLHDEWGNRFGSQVDRINKKIEELSK